MSFSIETDARECETLSRGDGSRLGERLCWYLSLAGETSVETGPLNVSSEMPAKAYRYDWLVGIACSKDPKLWWDWQGSLRNEDALKVQILVDCPKGVGWSDLSVQLLALHPSRDTTSWMERNAVPAIHSVGDIAKTVGALVPGLSLGGEVLNAIPSLDNKKKAWFMYRYYDAEAECPAIEWSISKDVMRQYGPLMHGTLVLAYHGKPIEASANATLALRAGLGLRGTTELEYARPTPEHQPSLRLAIKFEAPG